MKYLLSSIFLLLAAYTNASNNDSLHIENQIPDEDLIIGWPYYPDYHGVVSYYSSTGEYIEEGFSVPRYFTFTVERQMKKKENSPWNLGFGFGVVNMRSKAEFENGTGRTEVKTRRTYMAVPVYIKYDFLTKNKIKAYCSSGITAEFGINGKSSEESFQGEESTSYWERNFALGVGQFNINAGAGISYKLTQHLQAFAEANASSYFYESQNTLWTTKAVWLNLKTGLGVRF